MDGKGGLGPPFLSGIRVEPATPRHGFRREAAAPVRADALPRQPWQDGQ